MDTKIHACIPTYIHTYVRTYLHTYMHAYIDTNIHACVPAEHTVMFGLLSAPEYKPHELNLKRKKIIHIQAALVYKPQVSTL